MCVFVVGCYAKAAPECLRSHPFCHVICLLLACVLSLSYIQSLVYAIHSLQVSVSVVVSAYTVRTSFFFRLCI